MLLQKNNSIAVDRRHISVGSASLFDEGLIVSLNRLANLRLSVPFLLLILHQSIREQLDFRKDLRTAYIVDDSSPTATTPADKDLAVL